ncbi:MAG: HNH endonuclease [Muribaculaceae bacterium]
MKKDQFRKWLLTYRNIKSPGDFISKISTIEKYYGDIDEIYNKNKCVDLLYAFTYSSKDKEDKKPLKHRIPIKKYKNKDIYDTYLNTTQDYHSRLNRYIDFRNSEYNEMCIYPESDNAETCIEGAKITVEVNRYERSSVARQKCIEINGCYCHACDLDFSKKYGDIGKDFIHVHHKIPLNEISEEYVVDPVNDLIPVCPNCHAMLHRKINDKYLSIEELKAIIKK